MASIFFFQLKVLVFVTDGRDSFFEAFVLTDGER